MNKDGLDQQKAKHRPKGRHSGQLKVLVVTGRFPYPPIKGDQSVVFYRSREMGSKCELFLLTYARRSDVKTIPRIETHYRHIWTVKRNLVANLLENALELVFGKTPFQVLLFKSGRMKRTLKKIIEAEHFDVINFVTIRMAWAGRTLKIPRVVDFIDSMSINLERRAAKEKNMILRWLIRKEGGRLALWESALLRDYEASIFVSSTEASLHSGCMIVDLPLGVDKLYFQPAKIEQMNPVIVFSGNMGYFPNINAAQWFAEECLPLVLRQVPKAQFRIVGTNPGKTIKGLHDGSRIVVTGHVESIAAELQNAMISVAPMQSGSGMQFKILEAMACGLPVVTTRLGLGSIKALPDESIVVADDPERFADAVISLLLDSDKRRGIGASAREFVIEKHSWTSHAEKLLAVYSKLANKGTEH